MLNQQTPARFRSERTSTAPVRDPDWEELLKKRKAYKERFDKLKSELVEATETLQRIGTNRPEATNDFGMKFELRNLTSANSDLVVRNKIPDLPKKYGLGDSSLNEISCSGRSGPNASPSLAFEKLKTVQESSARCNPTPFADSFNKYTAKKSNQDSAVPGSTPSRWEGMGTLGSQKISAETSSRGRVAPPPHSSTFNAPTFLTAAKLTTGNGSYNNNISSSPREVTQSINGSRAEKCSRDFSPPRKIIQNQIRTPAKTILRNLKTHEHGRVEFREENCLLFRERFDEKFRKAKTVLSTFDLRVGVATSQVVVGRTDEQSSLNDWRVNNASKASKAVEQKFLNTASKRDPNIVLQCCDVAHFGAVKEYYLSVVTEPNFLTFAVSTSPLGNIFICQKVKEPSVKKSIKTEKTNLDVNAYKLNMGTLKPADIEEFEEIESRSKSQHLDQTETLLAKMDSESKAGVRLETSTSEMVNGISTSLDETESKNESMTSDYSSDSNCDSNSDNNSDSNCDNNSDNNSENQDDNCDNSNCNINSNTGSSDSSNDNNNVSNNRGIKIPNQLMHRWQTLYNNDYGDTDSDSDYEYEEDDPSSPYHTDTTLDLEPDPESHEALTDWVKKIVQHSKDFLEELNRKYLDKGKAWIISEEKICHPKSREVVGLIDVTLVGNVRDGFYRQFDCNGLEVTAFGRFVDGEKFGVVWRRLEGGGFVVSVEDANNNQESATYLYPDLTSAISGTFEAGKLRNGKFGKVVSLDYDDVGMPIPKVEVLRDDQMFTYDPSMSVSISKSPLVRDPYEHENVYVARSAIEFAGEGLYAKRFLPAGSLIALFNGIRQREVGYTKKMQEFSDYRIGMGAGEVCLDIPGAYTSLDKYCATLGHKACHSFKPNSGFRELAHPRFGRIMSIVAETNIERHQEILVSYNYRIHQAPQWYQQLYFQHLREDKQVDEEGLYLIARRIMRQHEVMISIPAPARGSSRFCACVNCDEHVGYDDFSVSCCKCECWVHVRCTSLKVEDIFDEDASGNQTPKNTEWRCHKCTAEL